MDEAISHIDLRLEPFKPRFIREVTRDDILKLMEIKMGRILKFNSDKSNEFIAQTLEQIAKINDKLEHIVDYTIDWFTMLKEKYGKAYPSPYRDTQFRHDRGDQGRRGEREIVYQPSRRFHRYGTEKGRVHM